jgi:hypothetical protein
VEMVYFHDKMEDIVTVLNNTHKYRL